MGPRAAGAETPKLGFPAKRQGDVDDVDEAQRQPRRIRTGRCGEAGEAPADSARLSERVVRQNNGPHVEEERPRKRFAGVHVSCANAAFRPTYSMADGRGQDPACKYATHNKLVLFVKFRHTPNGWISHPGECNTCQRTAPFSDGPRRNARARGKSRTPGSRPLALSLWSCLPQKMFPATLAPPAPPATLHSLRWRVRGRLQYEECVTCPRCSPGRAPPPPRRTNTTKPLDGLGPQQTAQSFCAAKKHLQQIAEEEQGDETSQPRSFARYALCGSAPCPGRAYWPGLLVGVPGAGRAADECSVHPGRANFKIMNSVSRKRLTLEK